MGWIRFEAGSLRYIVKTEKTRPTYTPRGFNEGDATPLSMTRRIPGKQRRDRAAADRALWSFFYQFRSDWNRYINRIHFRTYCTLHTVADIKRQTRRRLKIPQKIWLVHSKQNIQRIKNKTVTYRWWEDNGWKYF